MSTDKEQGTLAASGKATDSLGCCASRLEESRQILTENIGFYRKRSKKSGVDMVQTAGSGRGLLVGVSMNQGHRRRIFQGRRAANHEFSQGAMYIRSFEESYRAELAGGFDFFLMEISHDFFEKTSHRTDTQAAGSVACQVGTFDPTLFHLVQAMMPAFGQSGAHSALFVEQLGLTIGTHLLATYARPPNAPQPRHRILSRLQESRAKEMLMASRHTPRPIAEIARECGLSPSYFIHAFRQTTGQTPYRWLLAQRVIHACELLQRSSLPLADVAMESGFGDQSHFTRIFSQIMRTSPGAWRRSVRS